MFLAVAQGVRAPAVALVIAPLLRHHRMLLSERNFHLSHLLLCANDALLCGLLQRGTLLLQRLNLRLQYLILLLRQLLCARCLGARG